MGGGHSPEKSGTGMSDGQDLVFVLLDHQLQHDSVRSLDSHFEKKIINIDPIQKKFV